ncbi:MAG: hypothetical protein ACT4P3_08495 [Betaproteobacteria bacterium]
MTERLRKLLRPDASRWQPMLMGLACFAAAAGGAVLAQAYWLVSLLLSVLAFAAWVVGACAMVGYVRWFYAAEVARAREDREK